MKFLSFVSLLLLAIFSVAVFAAPVPSASRRDDCGGSCVDHAQAASIDQNNVVHAVNRHGKIGRVFKRQDGPVLPLPASGETLFSYLDRLLSQLPLLGKLLEGLGYVRPKQQGK
ncbi:hypothetical protein LPJ77_003440 [Coemansia sp. RSA 2523]|nr:hypothetical protein LPJ58_005572 [Coemansia sp. RSA 1591]KAJ1754020.1 hypothetical protein LPJ69_005576 [Coemansia sp. RSA 1752]KAJ1776464.1 hypothetical protein LPJ54_003054 [Coemansia sp. RSA 1824]KAJ1781465.1 hypothetical protein LPJ67_005481 [Coemansia sp. RSA 1938]KAJ1785226.1 hypothetical protein LPJ62_004315 [Coemansia sp. RSA 2167]KAJ1806732.1 hypothetical protein LPJ77_003440 [Coemansia sp. RSA 2523]KAJ2133472.1 hypothetical protein GGF48_000156 [Coemansia sp. RSA 921]KAJ2138544